MQEEWKSLKGLVECGDYYEISSHGRVRSIDRVVNNGVNGQREIKGELLSSWVDKDGYKRLMLYNGGNRKHYGLHRLVAIAFIDNPDNKPLVNHIDGIKDNNRLSNLEWSTESENAQHAVELGLRQSNGGENHANAKMTDEKAIEMFEKYKTDKYTMQELADEYGISPSVCSNIINGNSWTHLNLGGHKRDTKKRSIIDDELVVKVKEMYAKGYSKRKIERESGVSRTTVTKILDNY